MTYKNDGIEIFQIGRKNGGGGGGGGGEFGSFFSVLITTLLAMMAGISPSGKTERESEPNAFF